MRTSTGGIAAACGGSNDEKQDGLAGGNTPLGDTPPVARHADFDESCPTKTIPDGQMIKAPVSLWKFEGMVEFGAKDLVDTQFRGQEVKKLTLYDRVAYRPDSHILSCDEASILRKFVLADYSLNIGFVKSLKWKIAEIDEKALVEADAERIGKAFSRLGLPEFFVVRTDELLRGGSPVSAYRLSSTLGGVEEFQSGEWIELNIFDCLLFGFPLRGLVYRPGEVATSFIIGEEEFVDIASGNIST